MMKIDYPIEFIVSFNFIIFRYMRLSKLDPYQEKCYY